MWVPRLRYVRTQAQSCYGGQRRFSTLEQTVQGSRAFSQAAAQQLAVTCTYVCGKP